MTITARNNCQVCAVAASDTASLAAARASATGREAARSASALQTPYAVLSAAPHHGGSIALAWARGFVIHKESTPLFVKGEGKGGGLNNLRRFSGGVKVTSPGMGLTAFNHTMRRAPCRRLPPARLTRASRPACDESATHDGTGRARRGRILRYLSVQPRRCVLTPLTLPRIVSISLTSNARADQAPTR